MSKWEEQLDKEIRFHFESLTADYVRAGMTEEEARRRARIELGGVEQIKEDCRDVRPAGWIEPVPRDLRYAARTLRKSPAFTAAAIATLALGIGANTAIFQILDAVRLRSLPVSRPAELVRIQIRGGNQGWGISQDPLKLTWPLFDELRRQRGPFSGIFAWSMRRLRVGEAASSRDARAVLVSGTFFSTLGVAPHAGRLLNDGDDISGCAQPGVVLSHAFWTKEFGADPSAVGRRLVLDGKPHEVIGAAPPWFTGPEVGRAFDVILPQCAVPAARRDVFAFDVMARLKPGTPVEQASQYVDSISAGIFQAAEPVGYAAQALNLFRQFRLEAIAAPNGVSSLRKEYDTSLSLLFGITGMVLLIACANLANLMLARASARQREFSIRSALGASGRRLAAQVLAESVLLSTAGAVLGIVLSRALSSAVVAYLDADGSSVHLDLRTDARTAGFTGGVCIVVSLICGVASALRAAGQAPLTNLRPAMRERFSLQRMLVAAQISLSMVLVAGALLLTQSFRNLITMDPGFRMERLIVVTLDVGKTKLANDTLLERIRAIPQVEAAASTSNVVVAGGSWTLGIDGRTQGSKFTWVSPGHFETLRIPFVSGRDFNSRDTAGGPKVAIVNESFARRIPGYPDPLGRTFRTVAEPGYPETEYQIVGVVKDTRYYDIRSGMPPQSYVPDTQAPGPQQWRMFYVRSAAPPGALGSEIRRSLLAAFPGISVDFRILQEQVHEGLVRERLMAALSAFFGLLALLLAAIGLYGVVAYIGARRRSEIGIRMALGASRRQVVVLVMKNSAWMLLAGLGIGLVFTLGLARAAAALLFGVTPQDPVTLAVAALVLAAVAALGSYIPARRAARMNPMSALRSE